LDEVGSAIACAPDARAADGFLALSLRGEDPEDGSGKVFGVAPDGVTSVSVAGRSVPVNDNVYAIEADPRTSAKVGDALVTLP
jgi:hypothetical protein